MRVPVRVFVCVCYAHRARKLDDLYIRVYKHTSKYAYYAHVTRTENSLYEYSMRVHTHTHTHIHTYIHIMSCAQSTQLGTHV